METLKLDQSIGYRYCYLISVLAAPFSLFFGYRAEETRESVLPKIRLTLLFLGLACCYCIEWIVIVSQLHFPKNRLLFSVCCYSEKFVGC